MEFGNVLSTLDASRTGMMAMVMAMLSSFVLSQSIAWCYCRTYRGFSYARTFVHAMILGSLAVTIVIAGIGSNLALGLGVLGALAIIRFRTQIRDPRDIIFLFACLAVGIASGAGAYAVGILGTIGFIIAAFVLHWSPFASLHNHEGLVRFLADEKIDTAKLVAPILDQCCSQWEMSSMRDAVQGEAIEYTYQVRLRDPSWQNLLVKQLNDQTGQVWDASIMMHRSSVEV
jgi:uncharacterized membrane protein YhiD involved in acid resistance